MKQFSGNFSSALLKFKRRNRKYETSLTKLKKKKSNSPFSLTRTTTSGHNDHLLQKSDETLAIR